MKRIIILILTFMIIGCATNNQVKQDSKVNDDNEIILIFSPYTDEDSFSHDNKENTLETILTQKKKSMISKDGQVIYLRRDDINNLPNLTNKAIEIRQSIKRNTDIKKQHTNKK